MKKIVEGVIVGLFSAIPIHFINVSGMYKILISFGIIGVYWVLRFGFSKKF